MNPYKHTQIGYQMLIITVVLLVFFIWSYITALAEPSSVDSGPNFAISMIMVLIVIIISSFVTLAVCVDDKYLKIKFGYGLFKNKFPLEEIVSVKSVKNKWYYGWGIRFWFWPKMIIYNVSGFDAVEIVMKNNKIYRIGTDQPNELEIAIKKSISPHI